MMIAGTSAEPNKPITNEEMLGFYLDDAKTATRYNKLLDAKEVIIELMDLAREEGRKEGHEEGYAEGFDERMYFGSKKPQAKPMTCAEIQEHIEHTLDEIKEVNNENN